MCKCGYDPYDNIGDNWYQIDEENEIIILNTKTKKIKGGWEKSPVIKYKTKPVYPIITNYYGCFEGSINWTETHWCPECEHEFTLENGN
jgi:hypothetical protein